MSSNKTYGYGYQPLDEHSGDGANDTTGHRKLEESYELRNIGEETSPDQDSHLPAEGIGYFIAGIFIIGEICGAGAIAFPGAMSKTGLYGLILIAFVWVMCIYCGLLLGKSWKRINEQRADKEPIRDPYPYIGEMASGKGLRHVITLCLNVQLFLTCVVYLILAAEIVSSFISFHIGDLHGQANLRIWLVLVALFILPFTWLGTPKDFWFVALAAAGSTTIALILIWIKFGVIAPADLNTVKKADVTFWTLASAFGTFVFGFTGASLFPTIQSDMRNPDHFPKAAYIGYFGIFCLYVPTALVGYFVLGISIQDSILKTLSNYDNLHSTNRVLVSIAECLFAAHFVSGFVLMINPFFQQLENHVGVPYEFSIKRVGLRSGILFLILSVCELFPQFGPIVDLVGGSVNVFLCFIFPIWCYLKLYPETERKEKILMIVICIIAVLGGVTSTLSNAYNIKTTFHELYFAKNATGHPF